MKCLLKRMKSGTEASPEDCWWSSPRASMLKKPNSTSSELIATYSRTMRSRVPLGALNSMVNPNSDMSLRDEKYSMGPDSNSIALVVRIIYGISSIGVSKTMRVETGSQH